MASFLEALHSHLLVPSLLDQAVLLRLLFYLFSIETLVSKSALPYCMYHTLSTYCTVQDDARHHPHKYMYVSRSSRTIADSTVYNDVIAAESSRALLE